MRYYIGMKNSKQVTNCVSITDKAIKFVQGKVSRFQSEITAIGAVALNNKNDEEITSDLSALFKEKKYKKADRLVLLIPRQLVTLHYVKLPSVIPEEIKEMARLQAAKQLPFDPHEIVLGYQTLRITQEGYSEIILIIAHQDIINRYLKILRKIKLEPEQVTVDSEGMVRWFSLQKEPGEDSYVMVVDLDWNYARLDIISSGISVYSRAFVLNSDNIDEYKRRLSDEITRSINAYQKENIGEQPNLIYWTGADEYLNSIDEEFMKEFPFGCRKIEENENMQFKEQKLKMAVREHGKVSFASLYGIVLSKQKQSFNLLPADIKEKKQKTVYQRELRKTAIFSFFILITIFASLLFNIYIRQVKIDRLNKQLSSLSKVVGGVEKMAKKLNYVKSQIYEPITSLDALTEIFRIASSDINIAFFSYDVDKQVVLKGQAETLSAVFNFVNTVEDSKMFKDVQVRHSAKRKIKNNELADFEIVCLFERK